jgi:hypothetical protein
MHATLSILFNDFCFNNMKPSECWSLDGDLEIGVDVNPLFYSIVLWDLSTTHPTTFLNLFQVCILYSLWVLVPFCRLVICWLLAIPPSLTTTCTIFGWSFLFYSMFFHQLQVFFSMLKVCMQWRWTCGVLHHTL